LKGFLNSPSKFTKLDAISFENEVEIRENN
jgi:hypothetical protein